MAWYLVIDKDNNLVSSGSSVADDKTLRAKGYRKIELAGKPPENTQWDPVAGKIVQKPPEPPKPVSRTSFLKRLTREERTAIRKAAANDDVIDDLLYLLQVTEPLHLDDDMLEQGIAYLVSKGLLTDARRREIVGG